MIDSYTDSSTIFSRFTVMSFTSLTSTQQELEVLHLRNKLFIHKDRNNEYRTPISSNWRPTFHVTAPNGWLNDPCGPGYDPSTKKYHLGFQWNPKGNDWGNVSWGNATSYDLVSWNRSAEPMLSPTTEYDHSGVFTGCLRATDIDGRSSGALTCIYTSVSHLPIHYTLPYVRGCETLSLAVSHDSGKTWQRLECNPILPSPPQNLEVTGWRDPFVGPWRRTEPDQQLYGFISGGIVGQTPTIFAYTVNPKDLREWMFIGCLVDVGLNFRPSRWSGDFGVNWEVANVFDLVSQEEEVVSRTFMVVGTEGCLLVKDDDRVMARTARTQRQQLWMALKAKPTIICDEENNDPSTNTQALATYSFAGIFDHGCYYAANSFYDPVTAQHVVYGWITEEDLPDDLRHGQGWSGLISLPRTVHLQVLQNVVRARNSELQSITSMETEVDSRGTHTVRTLGIRPDDRLRKLRDKARWVHTMQSPSLLSSQSSQSVIPLRTSKWEVEAEFAVQKQCTRVGIQISHSAGMSLFITCSPIIQGLRLC